MVKLYFPLALLLGHVPLKAGRCDRKSIWLFDPHRGQGTRTGFFCFVFYGKQGARTKSQNHSACGVRLCFHKLFSSIRVWSSIWCISRFSSLACDSFSVRTLNEEVLISHKRAQVSQLVNCIKNHSGQLLMVQCSEFMRRGYDNYDNGV